MSIPSIVTGMLLVTDKLLNPGLVGGLARAPLVTALTVGLATDMLRGQGLDIEVTVVGAGVMDWSPPAKDVLEVERLAPCTDQRLGV